jgi:hypothetical protein
VPPTPCQFCNGQEAVRTPSFNVTGRDVEEAQYALKFSSEIGTWALLEGPATDYEVGETRRQILGVVRVHDGITPKDIAKKLDIRDDRSGRVPRARRLRGCSQRRPSALRVCHAARRRVLALTAQGRRHTIRPAMPLPPAPGRDRHGRTRPGIRRMTRLPALVAAPRVAARRLPS